MCSFGSCQTRFKFLSQFRKVRNAFECFVRNTGANAVAKNQTRLAYEDKCDLYCMYITTEHTNDLHNLHQSIPISVFPTNKIALK